MTTDVDTTIERFVRDDLGCGCPPEVFERIELRADAQVAGLPALRIEIGARLLVYLFAEPVDGAVSVQAVAEEGRAERDQLGLNRVRLVWFADSPPQGAADALAAEVGVSDDRLHVHVVDAGRARAVLAVAANPPEWEMDAASASD